MKPLAKTLTHALAAFGLAGAVITPAFAGEMETMKIAVETADLDLATPKGQKILDNRIEKAIRTVCRTDRRDTGSRLMSQDARACLVKARADTRQQVATLIQDRQRGG